MNLSNFASMYVWFQKIHKNIPPLKYLPGKNTNQFPACFWFTWWKRLSNLWIKSWTVIKLVNYSQRTKHILPSLSLFVLKLEIKKTNTESFNVKWNVLEVIYCKKIVIPLHTHTYKKDEFMNSKPMFSAVRNRCEV